MSLALYKPGQGYMTRMLSAVGAGVLILAGTAWLYNELGAVGGQNIIYIQAGVSVAVMLVFAGLTYWIMNKPRVVDFLIATEGEMKKVNWPTRREIVGSTWIVICGMFMMAILLFAVDIGFLVLFQRLGVLEG